ncbi:hypothetical protein ACWGIV_06110 [Streptomyces sp. NPDC054844]
MVTDHRLRRLIQPRSPRDCVPLATPHASRPSPAPPRIFPPPTPGLGGCSQLSETDNEALTRKEAEAARALLRHDHRQADGATVRCPARVKWVLSRVVVHDVTKEIADQAVSATPTRP